MPHLPFAAAMSQTAGGAAAPSSSSSSLAGWELALVVLVGSLVLVEVVYGVLGLIFRRMHAKPGVRLLERSKWGARALAISIAGTQIVSLAPAHMRAGLREVAQVLVVFSAAWIAVGMSGLLADLAEQRFDVFDVDVADNRRARRAVTQLKIVRRIVVVGIVIVAVVVAVISVPQGRAVGASFLGAVGVIGIVVGIAGQSTLGNVVAGLQVTFSDSLRIGDVVVVEGEWGTIEEISLTFVVVKVWDLRRLVVPVSYFVNNSFENWTRKSAQILGTVMLYVDYDTPVDAVREEFTRYVAEHPLWDHSQATLQMVEANQMTVQLRLVMSASTSGKSWDLRCAVREHMIQYLRESFPGSLPRARLELADGKRHVVAGSPVDGSLAGGGSAAAGGAAAGGAAGGSAGGSAGGAATGGPAAGGAAPEGPAPAERSR